jgi:hypothetical protein
MFQILLLSFITCFLPADKNISTMQKEEDFIDWQENRKLSWDDFQGKPDKDSPNAALTSSGIQADFSFGSKGYSFSIRCRFNKNRSWVKIKTDNILSHEQGHFDITEIFARKFCKALREYRYNEKTVQQDLQKIYHDVLTEHQEWQVRYDRETNHSINREEQQAWERKIADALKSLEDYKDYK